MPSQPTAGAGAPDPACLVSQLEREFALADDPLERIRQALEEGAFALLAQPILALRGEERFPMAEVLVRLREEELALLPPGEFFRVFEHYDMMPELDRWVLRHTIAQLARGCAVPRLSINVSGQTLADAGFPAAVGAELAGAGVSASALVFEIAESDALGRSREAGRFAAELRALGSAVALDGFGQLAASFALLREIPTDFVKVDGAVVRRLRASDAARARLRAVVRVGAVLGFGVIAECVEDAETLERVRESGAHYAQGFGVRRPEPVATVAEARF
jgi:EAL domain-containing protein (putative c-di-GMP-specific phosphodiesterase class I)